MHVLLVYPEYPDTFWSFRHIMPFIARKAAFPPLGLLTVAAMLPGAWEKRLVDLNVRELTDEDIAWADVVMVSAMLVQSKSALTVIARARAAGRRVVMGGPAPTAQPERFREADHLVLGEAETALPAFLRDFGEDGAGSPLPTYEAEGHADIRETPLPAWELISFRDYVSMTVQYSRGCPFDCEFCSIVQMYGRRPRVKSPEQMLREVQALYDAGWRDGVFIVDDNFIGNKAQVKLFLARLAEWQRERRHPFCYMTEASINLAGDEELMQLMSRANFHKVFIGIETPSEESLKECGKAQNVRVDFRSAVRAIHQHGMQVMGGFIVGFDSDTEGIFERQIRFIQEIGVVTAMVGMLNAIPGTRLWRRLKDEGRIAGDSSGDNTDGDTNVVPRMGREKLIEGYRRILATIYEPRHYYRRINTFLAGYNPTARGRIAWRDVRAFTRSAWSIGVLSRARFAYWKLMLRTALTRRRALPVAVELAILGQHFQRVARAAVAGTVCADPAHPGRARA